MFLRATHATLLFNTSVRPCLVGAGLAGRPCVKADVMEREMAVVGTAANKTQGDSGQMRCSCSITARPRLAAW